MSYKFKIGNIVKIKPSISKNEMKDYGVAGLCSAIFPKVLKIINHVSGYYTDRDYVLMENGREYICPPSILELATEDDVRKASWFPKRKLDISSHHKTRIFK